jgi:hypothetical protein
MSEGVAEVYQILLRHAYVFQNLLRYDEYCRRDSRYAYRPLIAVYVRCKYY